MKTRRLAVALAALALWLPTPLRAADGPYRQVKEIAIGGEGGWDYLSVDTAARRLYVSHGTKVVVVDIDKDSVVGEIAPAPGVHGIALAPNLGRGFVSNGRESTASIVDLKTLQIVGTVKTGENPDAILYEPVHKEVYAFNGRGKSATVFDAKTGEVRATIPLPGKPEFAVFDEKAGRIYNNIEDTSQLVVAVAPRTPDDIPPARGAAGRTASTTMPPPCRWSFSPAWCRRPATRATAPRSRAAWTISSPRSIPTAAGRSSFRCAENITTTLPITTAR